MHTGNSHRGILEYALAPAPPLLPAPLCLWPVQPFGNWDLSRKGQCKTEIVPS